MPINTNISKLVCSLAAVIVMEPATANSNSGEKAEKKPVEKPSVHSMAGIQKVEKILKENADCAAPIIITDSIIFSPASPKGFGHATEIQSTRPDDTLYFETEHNTVWYKFTAPASGNLTFDIIPVALCDDYDFILYKYNEKDFKSRLANKTIKPIRTCISRNDKDLNSATGLSAKESSEKYIHSGPGASYVKYVRAKKGDVFYLLLDNVKNNGNGHYIHLHYKTFAQGELYPGLLLPFGKIKFIESDYEFMRGTKTVLDSLYTFLIQHPAIQIEIQGHVNKTKERLILCVRKGAYYTEEELSIKRAYAIREYLTEKGIDSRRILCKGFGSKCMKNPKPKTPKECYENIRAEIYVASLDYINDPALTAF
ncbi:MAG: OmpA family protein [Bacteroidia bacterium]